MVTRGCGGRFGWEVAQASRSGPFFLKKLRMMDHLPAGASARQLRAGGFSRSGSDCLFAEVDGSVGAAASMETRDATERRRA